MKKIFYTLIVFSLGFISCGGGSSGTGGYAINGKVVTPANVGISDVVVEIYDVEGNLVASTQSGADGSYQIPVLDLNEFYVVVEADEFYVKIPEGKHLVDLIITVSEEFVDFDITYEEDIFSDSGDIIIENVDDE